MEKIDTFTLRIAQKENEEIKRLAKSLGMSQNALILLSVNLFKRSYADIISQNQSEFLLFLARKQQPNS